jgi:hypothetical protein
MPRTIIDIPGEKLRGRPHLPGVRNLARGGGVGWDQHQTKLCKKTALGCGGDKSSSELIDSIRGSGDGVV